MAGFIRDTGRIYWVLLLLHAINVSERNRVQTPPMGHWHYLGRQH